MSERHTGLDRRGDRLLIATTNSESGRLVVERLEELPLSFEATRSLAEEPCLRLSVSDQAHS